MFLKRLESVGFKSFAERIHIDFVSGITAVVGPNGSGKSNIIDAIRWVMGEQSAKSLRGQKMEDIIFQGSESRKPLNYAEVSLILNNEENKLPIDYQEVNVTRRVYRSGESEFFINKQACRLKDIVDLFMDTGLGRESFSVIGQGQIDNILSSKAEERRAVFEEAAGVLKYKQRKNKAEFKLLETADNLDRVEDIIHEINQQLGPLEKQAEVAKQYKAYKATLKEMEVALFITEINELHTKWQAVLKEIEQEQLEEVEERTRLHQKEADIEKERHLLQQLDEDMTSLQQDLLQITEQVEQFEGERNVFKERFKHMQENKQKLETEKQAINIQINQQKEQLGLEQTTLSNVTNTLTQMTEKLSRLKNQLAHGADATEAEVENLKSDYIEYLNERAALQNEEQSLQRRFTQLMHEKQEHTTKRQQSIEKEPNISNEKEQLEKELQQVENNIEQYEAKITQSKAELHTERNEYDEMQHKLHTGNEQIARLHSRKEMLEEMKESFQGFFYGVKEILKASKANQLNGIYGAVLDVIDVPTDYITAIDTVLGAQAQYVVVPNDEIARQTIQWLKTENKGRATFLPIKSIEARQIPNAILKEIETMNGFIGVASDLVKTQDTFQVVAKHLLGNVIVTNNLATANIIAQKTGRRYRIVTLEGDMVFPGGSMSGGAQRKKNQSLFTREKELQVLEKKLLTFTERANVFTNKVQEKKNKIDRLVKKIEEEEKILQEDQQKRHKLRDTYNEFMITWKSKQDELSTYQMTIDQISAEMNRLEQEESTITKKLNTLEDKIKWTESEIERLTEEINQAKKDERLIAEQVHELEINIAETRQLKSNHDDKVAHLQEQVETNEQKYKEIMEQLQIIANEEEVAQSEEQLDEKIISYREKRQWTESKIEEKRVQRATLRQKIEDEEKETKALSKVHEALAKKVQEKEVQANRLDVALENKLQTLQSEYVMTYEKACHLYEPVTDTKIAREEVNKIKHSIERLGTVNLGAIDEYERLMERYQFLHEQQTDLIEAKKTLYEVIGEMDTEMTERFETVFTEIQDAFTDVFKKLFGGGDAKLSLTDPENLLETGIEIAARPPGKKLKTLGLLSGGERALTAIALLFAILRVRPVPFCILDEVDAALDEANVERFAQYLHAFSEETQFIVITHRNGTMEEADALYGVTMQESGVSRLVSVRLEETEDLVQAT